jgi:DNA-binding transcriptional ArsR family regulator
LPEWSNLGVVGEPERAGSGASQPGLTVADFFYENMRMHADSDGCEALPDATARAAAEVLSLLCDETRLKIMWVLMQGSVSVGTIAELVDSRPSTVSQHLAKLRLAGIVEVRREGTFAYYRACDDHIYRILVDLLDHTTGSALPKPKGRSLERPAVVRARLATCPARHARVPAGAGSAYGRTKVDVIGCDGH